MICHCFPRRTRRTQCCTKVFGALQKIISEEVLVEIFLIWISMYSYKYYHCYHQSLFFFSTTFLFSFSSFSIVCTYHNAHQTFTTQHRSRRCYNASSYRKSYKTTNFYVIATIVWVGSSGEINTPGDVLGCHGLRMDSFLLSLLNLTHWIYQLHASPSPVGATQALLIKHFALLRLNIPYILNIFIREASKHTVGTKLTKVFLLHFDDFSLTYVCAHQFASFHFKIYCISKDLVLITASASVCPSVRVCQVWLVADYLPQSCQSWVSVKRDFYNIKSMYIVIR